MFAIPLGALAPTVHPQHLRLSTVNLCKLNRVQVLIELDKKKEIIYPNEEIYIYIFLFFFIL